MSQSFGHPPPVGNEARTAANQFLNNANAGLNRVWRWVLGGVFIILIWQGIGNIPLFVSCEYLKRVNLPAFTCEDFIIVGDSLIPQFVLSNYAFILGIIGVWIAIKLLHKKSLTQVTTGRTSFDYNRVLYAIWIGLCVYFAVFILEILVFKAELTYQAPNPWEYLTFFLFAIVLVPYQAGFEEIFFRGYLLQAFTLVGKNKAMLALASGVVFTIPHLLNPEPWAYGLIPYVISLVTVGAFLALMTLLDGGIELAVGYHAINNLFISLIANTEISVSQTPSLFVLPPVEYALLPGIMVQLVSYGVVFVIFNHKYKWINWRS